MDNRMESGADGTGGRPTACPGRACPVAAWIAAHRATILEVAYWSAVALIALLYFAACFQGVANIWQWGHNGYNGAAFSQAARNSLRFGMLGQAQYYVGLDPPPPELFYTHHPMMLHLHLIALFKLFGVSELVGRLVPATYSCASLVVLFLIVRRYFGKAMALASIIAYALIPLNLIFANMINHEQGSIFWCLFFLYMYLRWLETKSWVRFVLVMLGVSMAIQFDWPGYYLALFVVIHAVFTGFRHHRGVLHWRPEYTFVLVFSVVVLGNFYLFYSFIIDLRGGFHEMKAAFDLRSSAPGGYFDLLWERTLDLQGILFVGVLALWIISFFIRLARSTLHLGDLVPLFLLLAQAVHSLVFKQAGHIHAYWTYHLNPGLAIMAAYVVLGLSRLVPAVLRELLGLLFRLFGRRLRSLLLAGMRPILMAFSALIVLIPLGYQTAFAYQQFQWGFRTGTASYAEPYDDQYYQIRWVQEVRRQFDRTDTLFILHPSLQFRIEWLFYLDAPNQISARARVTPRDNRGDRRTVFLFDLDRAQNPRQLARLVQDYRTAVYDRRFVVVDGSSPDGSFAAFVHEDQPASWLWRWLVNPVRPPTRWVPDPDTEQVRALFATDIEITGEAEFGGHGGEPMEWYCPKGYLLAGFDASVVTTWTTFIGEMRPICRQLVLPGQPRPERDLYLGPTFGSCENRVVHRLECSPDQVMIGMFGASGILPDSTGIVCATPVIQEATEAEGGWSLSTENPIRSEQVGGPGGGPYEFVCPTGSAAGGFKGNVGLITDGIGISCVRVNQSLLSDSDSAPVDEPEQRRDPRRPERPTVPIPSEGSGIPPALPPSPLLQPLPSQPEGTGIPQEPLPAPGTAPMP
ncbi:MAG: glycosyltransferase family 39 protein [Bradymonadales bacterium]|nr:glycosyltransferase family 39 protein [Bradymonadales bacterium]